MSDAENGSRDPGEHCTGGNTGYIPEKFETRMTVLPEDIDIHGHVNNIVYLGWVQDASAAHWSSAATEEQKASFGWFVVRHELDYLFPARLGDEIIARTWVGPAARNLFERHVEMIRASDGKVLAKARSLWCPVDMKTKRPCRVPSDIFERFSSGGPRTGRAIPPR